MRLIGYITSGYPSIEGSCLLAEQYLEGGCDMLEISLPLIENKEAPYLSELMVQAFGACPDYDSHLEGIRQIAAAHPGLPITLLLYNEVAQKIGPEKLAAFCEENGIQDVNSADLSDPAAIAALARHGVQVAGLVRANFSDADVTAAKETKGFVYMTAFAPPEKCRPGYETIKSRIAFVRNAGIQNPIFCGGGVRKPEDAALIRDAGADGVFLGTSILKLQGQGDVLVHMVRAFRSAIDQ